MRALLVSLIVGLGLFAPTTAYGERPPQADIQVVDGQPADPGEDPWMAALVLHERYEPNPFAGLGCGASFISPDTLVTAAHCVEGESPDFLQVVAGSTNLLPAETERLDIRNIRVHPLHSWRTGMYDAAVIQLVHPPTVPVTPIDLVSPDDADLWEPGDVARFTGWGEDELRMPISQLQEGEAPIVSDTDCRARYTHSIFHGRTMVCVGHTDGSSTVSPCYGDSGGPLTVLDGARPVLVGLVLGGLRCGDPNYPELFTQVSALTDFLTPYLDPDTAPDAVQRLSATRRGPQGRAIVALWRPPEFDGGAAINRQIVRVQPGNRTISIGGRATRLRIPQVPTGVTVRVTVTPRNPVGLGPATTVEVPA